MPRVLLLLPAGTYRADDFLAAAARLGAEVVVGSDREQAMGALMGDRSVVVDLCDPVRGADAIVALDRRTRLDAVVPVDESGVLVAALAGARLGLQHNEPAAVAATRDKSLLRSRLAAAGVEQPRYALLEPADDPGAVAAGVGFPAVLKPLPLSASRGVIRVDDPAAARTAAARVRAIVEAAGEDPRRPLLVERFVPGAEVAVEGLLRAGELEVLAVFDKPDPLEGPYFEETIYVTPSRLGSEVQTRIHGTVAAAARGLGLSEGPVHAEARVDGPRVSILEVAARSIGGLCARALRFGAGISLEELILRHALGLPTTGLRREDAASGVMMIPIPVSGRLVEVAGVDRARAVEGVAGVDITVNPGGRLEALPEGDRYLGFIFARGGSPAAVEAALRRAHAALRIDIDPAAA